MDKRYTCEDPLSFGDVMTSYHRSKGTSEECCAPPVRNFP